MELDNKVSIGSLLEKKNRERDEHLKYLAYECLRDCAFEWRIEELKRIRIETKLLKSILSQ